ncbi:hypothetical protein BpHYR1_035684 [Brachionus plicatilis]|uniref:Uncharacterized protein n=1 Tax=Brachionus plicatilis TaxID=10195 RepID=A0A3M7QKY7_BRAPC|nr:hypothetical protein BpHYR1_035684 [Brachionus plicatilis]
MESNGRLELPLASFSSINDTRWNRMDNNLEHKIGRVNLLIARIHEQNEPCGNERKANADQKFGTNVVVECFPELHDQNLQHFEAVL